MSPAMMNLTEGAILIMSNPRERKKDPDFKPVLQIMDIRLETTDGRERCWVVLTDGTGHTLRGMLMPHWIELVRYHRLQKGSVVQIDDYVRTTINNPVVIIVIDLKLLLEKGNPIGVPLLMPSDGSSSNTVKVPNLPPPTSIAEISEYMIALTQKLQEFANRDASLQHEYEVGKKAREEVEAALQELKHKLAAEQKANERLREELDFIKTHGPSANQVENATSFYGFFEDVARAARDVGCLEALIALRDLHPDVKLGGLPGADWARQEMDAKKKALNDLFVKKVCDGKSFKFMG